MCMMLMSMSAFAQEVKLTDIKGVFIDEDGETKINIAEFLSVPEYKAAYLAELNRRLKENMKKKGITDSKLAITDLGTSAVDDKLMDNVTVGEGKSGKRKAHAAATMGIDTHDFSYTYESIDGKKNPITLSARAYVPTEYVMSAHGMDNKSKGAVLDLVGGLVQLLIVNVIQYFDDSVQSILLSCHPTVTSNFEAPTGPSAPENAIKCMNSEKCLVICPDYCGYGVTSFAQHPYLVQDITARQCIDAELAAFELIGNLFGSKSSLDEDYYTNIIGYSQGGSVALACAKYLESDACPQEVKDKIKLKHTYCGDGPYSTVATVKQYLEWEKDGKVLEYPCVLPLIVMAAKDAYDDDCMHSVKVEDYFSKDFIKTGVVDMIKSKSYTTLDLNNAIVAAMGTDEKTGLPRLMPKDLFSKKMLDEDSNEHKCLMRALGKNDLTKGWTPTHKITFYHWKNDGVVPYCNTQEVMEGIGKNNDKINFVTDEISDFAAYYRLWSLALSVKTPATEDIKHADAGIVFYIYYFSGALRPDDEQ